MSSKPLLAASAVLAAALLVGVSGAFGRASDDPGVTATTILLGGTAPLSSADAAVARGAAAYFKYVNARGGVSGRAILYRVVDDSSDPGLALQATRQLVERDRVLAIAGSLGTEQNLAARDYLNAAKVPQLFAASGATTFGEDFERYPWTIGFSPSHRGRRAGSTAGTSRGRGRVRPWPSSFRTITAASCSRD